MSLRQVGPQAPQPVQQRGERPALPGPKPALRSAAMIISMLDYHGSSYCTIPLDMMVIIHIIIVC